MLSEVLPWQHTVWQQLLRYRSSLPHALLFTGKAGIGKFLLAKMFAQLLLCQQPNATISCGKCHSCHLYTSGHHPDFYLIEPEEVQKAIKIEQVRALNQELMQKPFLGGVRVIVVHPLQALNQASANALLKVVEEPPARTLFIFCGEESTTIPPTLRSRCQVMRLAAPSLAVAHAWLAQQIGGSTATQLLALSQGAPLTALAMQEHLAQWQAIERILGQFRQRQLNLSHVAIQLNSYELDLIWRVLYQMLLTEIRQCFQAVNASSNQPMAAYFAYLDQLHHMRSILWLKKINLNRELTLENWLIGWANLF